MSDQANPLPSPESESSQPPRRRGLLFIVTVVLAAGLTGALGTAAVSHWNGPGNWGGPGHWRGGMMGGAFDPAQAEERADRMVRHLAVEIDANADQQEKLRTIVRSAVRDILPMRERVQTARQQIPALLTQPTINRAEIEKFRVEQVAAADAFTKRIAQALADAAEVLTPEQRRKVGERLRDFESFRGGPGWRRG